MTACIAEHVKKASTARLVIHAAGNSAPSDSRVAAVWRWLLAWFVLRENVDDRLPLSLHIDDLQGRRVHAVNDAGPLIDVSLSAGTYHVTALLGGVQRGYTIALASGVSFDLYLRLAADRR